MMRENQIKEINQPKKYTNTHTHTFTQPHSI